MKKKENEILDLNFIYKYLSKKKIGLKKREMFNQDVPTIVIMI